MEFLFVKTLGRLEKTVFGRAFEATQKTEKKGDGERTRRHPLFIKALPLWD